MKKDKINTQVVDIDDLVQDDHNFNVGTQQGAKLICRSFKEHGAGRSVLIDKNNRLVGGNKAQQGFRDAGYKKVVIVDSTPDTLIAVRRKDIDLDSKEGREMAMLDNLTQQVNLKWDDMQLHDIKATVDGFNPKEWGMALKELEDKEFEEQFARHNNSNAVYPLIPKYDEKHELFIIVSDSEVNSNYLREILNMQKMKSYKSGKITKSNVVHIKDVIHELENRNSKS